MSVYSFKVKVLLIVNTAAGRGFTPQYDELHQKAKVEEML